MENNANRWEEEKERIVQEFIEKYRRDLEEKILKSLEEKENGST